METMTNTAAATTAARAMRAAVLCGADTAHWGGLGQATGCTTSGVGFATRNRIAGVVAADAPATPATGSAHPRLEGPPV